MELNDAIRLISHQDFEPKNKTNWIDLGAGSGTFTLALASLLSHENHIYAVDTNANALKNIPASYNSVAIEKIIADFTKDELPLQAVNGVMLANSLHFVQDQEAFIKQLKNKIAADSYFLVIEYDSNQANQWVPYPINFQKLKILFSATGFKTITRLNVMPSIYGNRQIYAAFMS
ncbi:class I SAM-dependent methyltransferase [Emticicia sp. 17c]|uniref:class I SAM-dependent methyltransferase n=1 Tax=Emticicia sp. 17c TaxID=3127704 RepID=UPI00301C7538